VLEPNESSPNARPGAEVYFKKDMPMSKVDAVMKTFTQKGLDGFTLAVDPRVKVSLRPGQEFIGLRIQYIPEFDGVSPEDVDRVMGEKRLELVAVVDELYDNNDVAFAAVYNYDTEVVSGENYDEYIDRGAASDDRGAGSRKPEQSVRQRLERAASRIQSDAGTNSPAGVPDAGGAVSETKRSPARDGRSDNGSGRSSGAADQRTPPPRYGQAIEGSTSAVGYHFSKQPRTALNSNFYGQGLKGLEAQRLAGAENSDIRPRAFFYTDKGNGIQPEDGVGGNGHHVQLENLYDAYKDPLGIVKKHPGANNWERAIIKDG